MNGAEVKQFVLDNGLKLWQVAERWGLNDGNFSRRLRKPFSENEVKRIEKIVSELKFEQEVERDEQAIH